MRDGRIPSNVNPIVLQETAEQVFPAGASGAAVLVASLLLTAAWLLYLGR
jgi:hypothetical protein